MSRVHLVNPSDWGPVCQWFIRILHANLPKVADFEVTMSDESDLTANINYFGGWYSNKHLPRGNKSAAALHHTDTHYAAAWFTDLRKGYVTKAPEMLYQYDYLISSSQYWADFLVDRLSWPADRIRVAYPGADNGYPLGQPRKITIGMCGDVYINGRKREWSIAEAFWKMGHDNSLRGVKFHFLGNAWERTVEQLRALGLEAEAESIHYDEYPNVMKNWDYLLSPGFAEGGPMSVIRALRMGLGVIATPTGVAADFAEHCILFETTEDLARIFRAIRPRYFFPEFKWADWLRVHKEVFTEMLSW